MSEKILVTGVKGQLGYDIVKQLTERGIECKGVDIEDFDITDLNAVEKYICEYSPTAVIHCSAYTAVDKAEEFSELCYKVNADGPKNIALSCKKIGAKMAFVSTDYVFDGSGDGLVSIDKPYGALNVYGRSKVEGEKYVKDILDKYFIVRTSWVFGKNGNNFIKTMLRLAETKTEVSVVNDQIGSPTYTVDLARLLIDITLSEKYGVYHGTNENYCSFADLARLTFELTENDVKVNNILTKDYVTPATRPLNSRLDKKCLDENGFMRMPTWQNAVERYLEEIGAK